MLVLRQYYAMSTAALDAPRKRVRHRLGPHSRQHQLLAGLDFRSREGKLLAAPESSRHVLETLWKTRSSSCSGASRTANRCRSCRRALGGTAFAGKPRAVGARLCAYALRDEFDPARAARPSRLEPHGGRLTLLSEDQGAAVGCFSRPRGPGSRSSLS